MQYSEEKIQEMLRLGYCRTSNRHRILSRIDRPNWREHMARNHAPWDPHGQGMEWASGRDMADWYRRCLSRDKIEGVPDEVFRRFPLSGGSNIGYVARRQEKPKLIFRAGIWLCVASESMRPATGGAPTPTRAYRAMLKAALGPRPGRRTLQA